jgi:hypothetical protein
MNRPLCTGYRLRNGIATVFRLSLVTQSMPSNKVTAAAPIATGVLLAGTATREVAQNGFELWTTLALAGGLSAVAVGLGVLTGLGGFDSDDDLGGRHDRTTVALVGLALTSLAVGAGIALS